MFVHRFVAHPHRDDGDVGTTRGLPGLTVLMPGVYTVGQATDAFKAKTLQASILHEFVCIDFMTSTASP